MAGTSANRAGREVNCFPQTLQVLGMQARIPSIRAAIATTSTPEYLMLIATAHASAIDSALGTVSRFPARQVAVMAASIARLTAISFFTMGAWARQVGSSATIAAAAIAAQAPAI